MRLAVLADCLRDRQDVILVEISLERGTAMPGRTEGNHLARVG
jgi:hypothetical protein